MRILPLLLLAGAPLLSSNAFAQVADTDFHAFAPPAAHASTGAPTDGMTVYRPPGAGGAAATVGMAAPQGVNADAPSKSASSPASLAASQDDPYTQSLRQPYRMPVAGEPLLPPPVTAKGLPLPPIPMAPGSAAPAAYQAGAPVSAPPEEQINAYAPPTAAKVAPAGDTLPSNNGQDLTGIPEKVRELIEEKYSVAPPLREAAIAFVRTNLEEWNQVHRTHKFSRVATRLSVEAQICLAAKIDHYAPDLGEGFTKEFKNALTSTSDLRQLYYDALQAAEYQEVVVDRDTDESCKDVNVTPENVDAP